MMKNKASTQKVGGMKSGEPSRTTEGTIQAERGQNRYKFANK